MRGFISNISTEADEKVAVIVLENKSSYIVPLFMLPEGIEVDDFVIIEHGLITIDPDSKKYKEELQKKLEEIIEQ